MDKKVYYFDYNATHPPFKDILFGTTREYSENFFNPSGATRFSLQRQGVIEEARSGFSKITNKEKNSFVFSSTGTEALFFMVGSIKNCGIQNVIVSPFEHSSLYSALNYFQLGSQIVSTNKSGILDLNHLEKLLKEKPSPVFSILASGETGVIQPMKEIYKLTQKYETPLFSDLIQAFCKLTIDFDLFDGFTISGHKIGGGMGASLTYVGKKYLKDDFQIFGGGYQENNHRAGTENTIAITSMLEATKVQLSHESENIHKLKHYQNLIEECLLSIGCEIIGKNSERLPSTTFAILPFEEIDFFMIALEEKGIVASTGSSCKSRSREASESLLNMGYTEEEALRAIRISTGIFTTMEEVDYLINSIKDIAKKFE